VILGAGEMAELAVEALRKRGANRILIVNRSVERAQDLVDRWNAKATTFEHLDRALEAADILISSTGAPHIILEAGIISRVMQIRPQRPLVLIDIAVPRDIDPKQQTFLLCNFMTLTISMRTSNTHSLNGPQKCHTSRKFLKKNLPVLRNISNPCRCCHHC